MRDGNGRVRRLLITFFLCQHGLVEAGLLEEVTGYARNRRFR